MANINGELVKLNSEENNLPKFYIKNGELYLDDNLLRAVKDFKLNVSVDELSTLNITIYVNPLVN